MLFNIDKQLSNKQTNKEEQWNIVNTENFNISF